MFIPQFRKMPYKLMIAAGIAFGLAGPINDLMTSENIEDYREDALKTLTEDARVKSDGQTVLIEVDKQELADEMQKQFKKAQNKETGIYVLYGLTGVFLVSAGAYSLVKNKREDRNLFNRNSPKPGI